MSGKFKFLKWHGKKAVAVLVLALLLTVAIIGATVAFVVVYTDSLHNVFAPATIEIDLDDGGKESIHFENLELVPGGSTEYTVTLKSELDGKYKISLEFKDENTDMKLKKYVYVRAEYEGKTVCDELLADVLDGDAVTFDFEMNANEDSELKITYYMPETVGNEAENAEAKFELIINYTNE